MARAGAARDDNSPHGGCGREELGGRSQETADGRRLFTAGGAEGREGRALRERGESRKLNRRAQGTRLGARREWGDGRGLRPARRESGVRRRQTGDDYSPQGAQRDAKDGRGGIHRLTDFHRLNDGEGYGAGK